MSARRSPYNESDSGLPPGIFVNPDTLPVSDPQDVVLDRDRSYSPIPGLQRGESEEGQSKAKANLAKMGKFFKKGTDKLKIKKKKDHDDATTQPSEGASQLGDVLGNVPSSSVASSSTSATRSTDYGKDELKKPGTGPVEQGFLRKPKPIQMNPYAAQPPEERYSPSSPAIHPSDETTLDMIRTGFLNFFKGPPAPSPPMSPNANMDKAPLHGPPPKSPCRISVILLGLFIIIIIIGIILLIFGGDENWITQHCKVLGPCFLGLGIFGLIGDIFFILFWNEDPLPMLNKPMEKINSKIGAVPDPYGLQDPVAGKRSSYYPGLLRQYVGMMGQTPESPVYKEDIAMRSLNTTYDDQYGQYTTSPAWDAPSGPAASFGAKPGTRRNGSEASYYDDDGSKGSLSSTQQDTQSASYYDEPTSPDISVDMRTRPGYAPAGGIHNNSYQPDDSYRQTRQNY